MVDPRNPSVMGEGHCNKFLSTFPAVPPTPVSRPHQHFFPLPRWQLFCFPTTVSSICTQRRTWRVRQPRRRCCWTQINSTLVQVGGSIRQLGCSSLPAFAAGRAPQAGTMLLGTAGTRSGHSMVAENGPNLHLLPCWPHASLDPLRLPTLLSHPSVATAGLPEAAAALQAAALLGRHPLAPSSRVLHYVGAVGNPASKIRWAEAATLGEDDQRLRVHACQSKFYRIGLGHHRS